MGDFNTIFKNTEAQNRAFNQAEKKVASQIKVLLEPYMLTDGWDKNNSHFTWRNSTKRSCLDRILWRTINTYDAEISTN